MYLSDRERQTLRLDLGCRFAHCKFCEGFKVLFAANKDMEMGAIEECLVQIRGQLSIACARVADFLTGEERRDHYDELHGKV